VLARDVGIALGIIAFIGVLLAYPPMWRRVTAWVSERELEQALLRKCRGDRAQLDRLLEGERTRNPEKSRLGLLRMVKDRWDRANR
jgi:hypothetical protein